MHPTKVGKTIQDSPSHRSFSQCRRCRIPIRFVWMPLLSVDEKVNSHEERNNSSTTPCSSTVGHVFLTKSNRLKLISLSRLVLVRELFGRNKEENHRMEFSP